MKIGTRSLLFGVHQFLWHPFTVALAWRRCYRRWPSRTEALAILVHDWGYWGCKTLDGNDGVLHPITGARIANKLSGPDAGRLVMFHSATFARLLDKKVSALFLPDKVSLLYEPRWFYLLRAFLSGEIWEFTEHASPDLYHRPLAWFKWYREHVKKKLIEHEARNLSPSPLQ